MSDRAAQIEVCKRVGAHFVAAPLDSKLGIALQTLGRHPLNGLRHLPVGGTCGWYVWAGEELRETNDFLQPLHVRHLSEHCPNIVPYLGLAPGWRFLITPGSEDAWFDESIVHE